MADLDVDIEKAPMTTVTSSACTDHSDIKDSPPPEKEKPKDLHPLQTFQTLIGDITSPPSANPNDESVYHTIIALEKKAKNQFHLTGALFFTTVSLQILLCLMITIGAQVGLSRESISIFAGVNTGVAALTGVLKGLGLPDKKGVERNRLTRAAERIRATTRKLRAGIEVDAAAEAEEIIKLHDQAADEGHMDLANMPLPVAKKS